MRAVMVAMPLLPLAFLLASTCVSHIPAAWSGAVREAALADCAFSDESQTTGAEAWAKYSAENAASGPLRGPAEIKAAQAKAYARAGYKLIWYPDDAKQMGSFVVTTGRWERHIPDDKGGTRLAHGRYVTMWQLQKDGSWKWVWDGGEEDTPAK